jgi:hypothetical protein
MTLAEFQSTIKYNPDMLQAFITANNIDLKEAMKKAQKEYNKKLTVHKNIPELQVSKKVKKLRTPAQKKASLVIKDRMETSKSDMIHHIEVLIKSGELQYPEFINDPTIYFDSQIMGVYYNNYIIRQAIIRYFEKEFIPF